MMYIINYQDQKGYTIISATKKYYPIIAYSDEGSFSLQESYNDGSSILLEEYNTSMEDDELFKKFIKDIRRFSKVTYKDKATGATMGNAVKAFKKLNYSAILMDYKRSETIQEIQNNRPVFMGGDRKAFF